MMREWTPERIENLIYIVRDVRKQFPVINELCDILEAQQVELEAAREDETYHKNVQKALRELLAESYMITDKYDRPAYVIEADELDDLFGTWNVEVTEE